MRKMAGLSAVIAVLCSAPFSLHFSPAKAPFLSVDKAEARIGRPLTPLSIAGVNCRWHRRAYYAAAATGVAAAALLRWPRLRDLLQQSRLWRLRLFQQSLYLQRLSACLCELRLLR
jgi:hypothetical protein